MKTPINLSPAQFSERENLLVQSGNLSATAFRFRSGVCGLRLENEKGSVTLLPFQGQQIWSAEFGGDGFERRTLTMRSNFEEPRPTQEFLATFGGFLLHCGATGVGAPAPGDTHPIHGELPNARYQEAYLQTGQDEDGSYIAMGGSYRHQIAFGPDYVAEPLVKLHADRTDVGVTMQITNKKRSDLELLYLAHVNFRPVDNGRLYYTAKCTPDHVRVRTTVPSNMKPSPEYTRFLSELKEDPSRHNVLEPSLLLDPEVVLFIDCLADEEGWAYSMQMHDDGSADYIRHRPDQLPKATRWISRTPDQDAIALVEPGTSEPEGYTPEKNKGNVMVLRPGDRFSATFDCGILAPEEASDLVKKIRKITET